MSETDNKTVASTEHGPGKSEECGSTSVSDKLLSGDSSQGKSSEKTTTKTSATTASSSSKTKDEYLTTVKLTLENRRGSVDNLRLNHKCSDISPTNKAVSNLMAPPNPNVPNQALRYNRIFKKSSQDGNLILFLPQRELIITESKVEPLMGVALIHENVIHSASHNRVFLQVVLIFRYGREDEELMGLRFCNEIVIAAEQIYPSPVEEICRNKSKPMTNHEGYMAVPVVIDMGISAPPSVRLLPCRPYNGAPIGTTYEVQLFAGKSPEELPRKRKMVQMSLRLYERLPRTLPPRSVVTVEKNYIFSENNLYCQAKLDNGVYSESDEILLNLLIKRPGGHGVKKLKVAIIQQVGVAMFSTGNFKNVVGTFQEELNPTDSSYKASIPLKVELNKEYSWVAMDETAKRDSDIKHLAPSVIHATKSMFIIRVQYYVSVSLVFGLLQRDILVKLPFLLKRMDEKKLLGKALAKSGIK